MIGRILDALGLRAPASVRHAADLRAGKAVVFGTLHTATPIRSPVHDKPCAAFYYRASFRRASRVKGFAQALLRDALVYAPGLVLTVDDVEMAVSTSGGVDFDGADHKALVARDIDGFRALEKRVPVGAQVAVHGVLTRRGDGWRMASTAIDHQGSDGPGKASAGKASTGKASTGKASTGKASTGKSSTGKASTGKSSKV